MLKRTYVNVFVLPSPRLVRPAADDDFVNDIITKIRLQ